MNAPLPANWSNWLDDHKTGCLCFRPSNKGELLAAVQWAVDTQQRVRATGSRHSHSNCARPTQISIDLALVSGAFDEVKWLKADPPGVAFGESLVRVKAGTTIKTLNRSILPSRGLALANMGAFDAQTVAGAINTATHGTGLGSGSLADLVLSVDMVTVTRDSDGRPDVRMRRIEPKDGITDRSAFNRDRAEHAMLLEQDDDVFNSVVVGFGCMGVAYTYTLRVRPAYWLHESRTLTTWPRLKGRLTDEIEDVRDLGRVPAPATSADHYWFMLNVAETQGDRWTNSPTCLVWRRTVAPTQQRGPHGPNPWPPERPKTPFQDFAKWLIADPKPTKTQDRLGERLRKHYFEDLANGAPFTDNHASTASYIAHRRTRDGKPADEPPEPEGLATSLELAVEATRVAEAVDLMLEEIRHSRYFFALPIGVRFGPPSRHFLAAAYGRPTAYVELPMLLAKARLGDAKLDEAEMLDRIAKPELARIDRSLRPQLAARPHLGKQHGLDERTLKKAFPRIDVWREVYVRFNAFGTFDNAFTKALGFSD